MMKYRTQLMSMKKYLTVCRIAGEERLLTLLQDRQHFVDNGEFIKIYAQLPRLRFCLISSCSKLFLLTHALNLINSTFRCVLTFEEVDVSPGSLDLYLESDKLGSRVRAYVSRIASQALQVQSSQDWIGKMVLIRV